MKLLEECEFTIDIGEILVRSMNDGGMGSIEIYPDGVHADKRQFGRVVSEIQLLDTDAVPVVVSLHIDSAKNLYEMEIWKADGSPVKWLYVGQCS